MATEVREGGKRRCHRECWRLCPAVLWFTSVLWPLGAWGGLLTDRGCGVECGEERGERGGDGARPCVRMRFSYFRGVPVATRDAPHLGLTSWLTRGLLWLTTLSHLCPAGGNGDGGPDRSGIATALYKMTAALRNDPSFRFAYDDECGFDWYERFYKDGPSIPSDEWDADEMWAIDEQQAAIDAKWRRHMEAARAGNSVLLRRFFRQEPWGGNGYDSRLSGSDLAPLLMVAADNGAYFDVQLTSTRGPHAIPFSGTPELDLFCYLCACFPANLWAAYHRLKFLSMAIAVPVDESPWLWTDHRVCHDTRVLFNLPKPGEHEHPPPKDYIMLAYEYATHWGFTRYAEACKETLEGVTTGEEILVGVARRVDPHVMIKWPDNLFYERCPNVDPIVQAWRRRLRIKAIEAKREHVRHLWGIVRSFVRSCPLTWFWVEDTAKRVYHPRRLEEAGVHARESEVVASCLGKRKLKA